ncbi:substrate-binding domain-containing protein, partial [Streptomyces sp. NPDC001215]
TVRQPLTEMAEAAAKLVLDLGREEPSPMATRVELATSLVVRSSTAAPSTGIDTASAVSKVSKEVPGHGSEAGAGA